MCATRYLRCQKEKNINAIFQIALIYSFAVSHNLKKRLKFIVIDIENVILKKIFFCIAIY